MSGEYIYSGGFWDSKTCAVCARWDRSGAAAPNSAPKIVWQFLEPSLVLLQQSTDQSEKSCEDNLPVSSNISKPNSAPKRCDRIGSASVATCPFLPIFATISRDKSHLPRGRNAFVAIEDSGQIRPCWWEHYRSRFWEKPDILKSCNNWFCPAVQDQRAYKLHSMFKVKAFWSAAASRGWINK